MGVKLIVFYWISLSYVGSAGVDNRSPSRHADRAALRRYFFDMRSETLPPEAEVVTGAVLRVYKFPAYVNMASTAGAGHAHHTQLVLHVYTHSGDVTTDWLVITVHRHVLVSYFNNRPRPIWLICISTVSTRKHMDFPLAAAPIKIFLHSENTDRLCSMHDIDLYFRTKAYYILVLSVLVFF